MKHKSQILCSMQLDFKVRIDGIKKENFVDYCKFDPVKNIIFTAIFIFKFYFISIIIFKFKKVCKGTSQEIYFWNWSFADSSLCSIIKASCNVNTLDFCSCKFSLLGPLSLVGPSYNIKELSFNYSGNTHSNDWSTYPERLNLLIKAISECSLKNSLEKISMASCGVKKEEIERMLKKYGINAQVFSD